MGVVSAHIFWNIEDMPPQAFIPDCMMSNLFDNFAQSLCNQFGDINITKVTAYGNENRVKTVGLDSRIAFENVPDRGTSDRRIYGAVMEAVVLERESGRQPCIVVISSDEGYLETLESLRNLNDCNEMGVFVRAISCVVVISRTKTFKLFELADCAWSPTFFYGAFSAWKPSFRYSSFRKVDTVLADKSLPLLRQPFVGRCERNIRVTLAYLRRQLIRPDFVNIGSHLFYCCSAFRSSVTIVDALKQVQKYLDVVSLVMDSSELVGVYLDKYVDRFDERSFIYVERGLLPYDFQDPYPYFDFGFKEGSYVKVVMDFVWKEIRKDTDLDLVCRLVLAMKAHDHLKKVLKGVKEEDWGWLKVSHIMVIIEFGLDVGRGYEFGISGYEYYSSAAFRNYVSKKVTDVRIREVVFGKPLSSYVDLPDEKFIGNKLFGELTRIRS